MANVGHVDFDVDIVVGFVVHACMCVHTNYFSCWKSSVEAHEKKRYEDNNNDNGDGNGEKSWMRFSCARQYGHINRNWRFHFIAHCYWFLLRSLTRSIEIKETHRPFVRFHFFLSLFITLSSFLSRSFGRFNLFNLFALEMSTPYTTWNRKTIQNVHVHTQSDRLICLCTSFRDVCFHRHGIHIGHLVRNCDEGRKKAMAAITWD